MNAHEQLDAVLVRYAHLPRIRDGVAALLGCADLADAQLVVAHAEDGPDVLAVYVLGIGWFGVYETNTAGDELLVCVPLERVSRVAEERRDGSTSRVVVEIDADRSIARTSTTADGATVTATSRAFYEMAQEGCALFAANLRAYLNQ